MKNLFFPVLLWLLALVPALAQTSSEVRAVSSFHAVEVSSGIELYVTAGTPQRVEVTADTPENRARIKTTVEDGVLRVKFDMQASDLWRNNRHNKLRVNVTAARLTGLSASSGSELQVKSTAYATADLRLSVSSGASLKGDFAAASIQAELSSGAEAVVSGTTQRLGVRTSGGGSFNGKNLRTSDCEAEASSGGSVAVEVQKTLSARASSGGSVTYGGAPQVSKHTSSGGSVSGR
ncbi:head GIN domain-containing protein [Hymenobacter baengnokdamensis]|uniref:head GIN domain-containing protein n=1 Tax=Hymenobacter baengnokdamensis TaxID=2615203 RepID=UPI001243C985|nr:head GIN domain-containing protein [Hymenobacter baengnokdamensis]